MNNLLIHILFFYYSVEFLFSRLIPFKKEDSILIVKLDAIGDMVIWIDVAEEIRSVYNDKKIGWITEPGDFEALAGTSSQDIKSTLTFR